MRNNIVLLLVVAVALGVLLGYFLRDVAILKADEATTVLEGQKAQAGQELNIATKTFEVNVGGQVADPSALGEQLEISLDEISTN